MISVNLFTMLECPRLIRRQIFLLQKDFRGLSLPVGQRVHLWEQMRQTSPTWIPMSEQEVPDSL